jgi:plastocyanin
MRTALFAFAVIALLALPANAMLMKSNGLPIAPPPQHLTIKSRAFTPTELDLSAGQQVQIIINNLDPMPAKFESTQLKSSKEVPANGSVTVTVGPLTAGTYSFTNGFDPGKSKGQIVVK